MQLEQVKQKELDIPSSCRLRVCVHGPLEVWKRGPSGTWQLVDKDAWGKGRPVRSVFKRLLTAPGHRLSRASIQEDLWPDTDNFALAEKNVYNDVNQIRRVIGKDLVRTYEMIYELADQSMIWVDLDACKAVLKEVENRGYLSTEALPLLEQALVYLERGELLEGESGIWVYGLRKKSEDMLKQCRLWLAQAYERQGKLWQTAELYRALLQSMPPDEEALQAWISMLSRQGKPQEALKCYQEMKTLAEAQGFPLSEGWEQMVATLRVPALPVVTLNSPFVQDNFQPTQGTIQPKELDDPMNLSRRRILQGAAGFLLPLFFGAGAKSALALDEIVAHSSHIITACWQLMKGKDIHAAEELLDTYTPALLHQTFQISPYQQEIAQITTQACMMRAIIAKHHLNPIAREMYCHEAIQCSRLSGDKALRAGALMYLGYTYTFCNPLRPQKAIETFLEALKALEDSDDLVKSDICIGLADAYALVNNELQAKRTIEMAQDCFPSRPEQSASFLYADCGLDTLYQWEAKMYLDLAQQDQRQEYFKNARNTLEQANRIYTLSERCMIETVIYQAHAALGLSDLDTYASCLEVGASTALQIGSQRRYQEALDLYQQVPKTWKQEPKIQRLANLFQEANREEKHA